MTKLFDVMHSTNELLMGMKRALKGHHKKREKIEKNKKLEQNRENILKKINVKFSLNALFIPTWLPNLDFLY